MRIAGFTAVAIAIAVIVVVGLLIGLRAYRQHTGATFFAIDTTRGIDESGFVEIGGIPQWVQIRGEDRDNPVLLCVHGGPGGTWIPVTRLFRAWEKEFTVVLWDQRGAGKTLGPTGPAIASTLSIERMAVDGIELAEHLCRRLGKEKIVLLGHSFGTILGTRMVKLRPGLFHAFVGTGQVSDLPRAVAMEYARLTAEARGHADDRTLRELEAIGPPPFGNMQQTAGFFQCSGRYQPAGDSAAMVALQRSLFSPPPGYSLIDEWNRMRGFTTVPPWRFYEEILNTNLAASATELSVPVVMLQGSEDRISPQELAEVYFESISAPRKEWATLPGGGHFAVWSMADEVLRELVVRVRPLAQESH